MVYFRDYQWLVINGTTRFDAYIKPGDKEAHWSLDMRCVASGLPWRRVREWERPSLWLVLSGFKPKLRTWTDLERMNFWNLEPADGDAFCGPGGWLDVDFYPKNGSKEREDSFVNDVIWRVAGREDGWFTVELAGFTDGRSLWQQLTAQ